MCKRECGKTRAIQNGPGTIQSEMCHREENRMRDAFVLISRDDGEFVKIYPDMLGMDGNQPMYCLFPDRETAEKVQKALLRDSLIEAYVLGVGVGDERR